MESMNSKPSEIPIPAVEAAHATKTKQSDRVAVGPLEIQKVAGWLEQIHRSSHGFLSLTKTDMVNFIIRLHAAELSTKAIAQIRSDHYDPARHMQWIAQQIKVAATHGDQTRLAELQKEIQRVEISSLSPDKTVERNESPSGVLNVAPSRRAKRKPSASVENSDVNGEDGVMG